jgi:sarcosine oxidase
MTPTYDSIVVGLGAIGSAALWQLARRGQRVLGLEMFEPGHDQGSSHGYHRMIRKSSRQDDGYVPLADRAFALWHEAEELTGQELLRIVGEVSLVQPGDDPRRAAVAAEMQQRGFWELLDEEALRERFPGFRLHDGMFATYEADAGFLWSERGIIAHVALARQHGATVRTGEEVTSWRADGDGVRVTTTNGEYRAGRLVLTPGPWAPELLADLAFPYRVIRSINGYFEPPRPELWTAEAGAPDFLLDVPEGSYYGMPSVDGIGVKIGRSATQWGTVTTARTIRRSIDDSEVEMMRTALDRYLPGAAGAELRRITCMCTYTSDDDFIVDRHPLHSQVSFGCGFSGRGYKFAPVIGEVLADLAIDGSTRHDIGFLSAGRFARA